MKKQGTMLPEDVDRQEKQADVAEPLPSFSLMPVQLPEPRRGRPVKTTAEKSTYSHLVLRERVIQSLDGLSGTVGHESVDAETTRREIFVKLNEIKQNPAANTYYWKLVFSYTFYLYRERLKAVQLPDQPNASNMPGISVRQMAQAAGLAYHNLKNLFVGHGTMQNLIDYQSFLYSHGINFLDVQYNPQVIAKAYFYLICLRQPTVSKDALNQLFF